MMVRRQWVDKFQRKKNSLPSIIIGQKQWSIPPHFRGSHPRLPFYLLVTFTVCHLCRLETLLNPSPSNVAHGLSTPVPGCELPAQRKSVRGLGCLSCAMVSRVPFTGPEVAMVICILSYFSLLNRLGFRPRLLKFLQLLRLRFDLMPGA